MLTCSTHEVGFVLTKIVKKKEKGLHYLPELRAEKEKSFFLFFCFMKSRLQIHDQFLV